MIEEMQKKILLGKLTDWLSKIVENEQDRSALMTKIKDLVKKVTIEKISFSGSTLELRVSWDASKK